MVILIEKQKLLFDILFHCAVMKWTVTVITMEANNVVNVPFLTNQN